MKEITGTKGMVLDSREVADMVGKDHSNLLKDIQRYVGYLEKSKVTDGLNAKVEDFFAESSYKPEEGGRTYRCYKVTKKGCEFIAHKLTGQKGAAFTATYINRFHELEKSVTTKALSPMDQLRLQYEALETHDEALKEHSNRIEHLENNMVIEHGQAVTIKKLVNKRVKDVLGGAYEAKSLIQKAYKSLWRDYKGYFNLTSYHNTLKKDFDEAAELIESWKPTGELLRAIREEQMQCRI